MGKILVADDQFGVRSLLVSIFREGQHEVETAENGAEALRLFITFEPDLILMKMQGMNGIETLRKIRVLDRRVVVITMTSYGDAQAMEQAKNLGILYYLGKPFDVFELIKWVREILNSSGLITKGSLLKRSLFMNNTV